MKTEIKVYLRPLRVEDASVSWRWRNDADIWRNTGSSPDRYVTEEMEIEWIKKAIDDPSVMRYAICVSGSNRYIGNAYLSSIKNGSAVEQIFIGEKELWGNGVGTQARAILYGIAKRELGLNRIESHIRPRNIASIKSVLKLGFGEVSRDEEWIKLEKSL